ncbi:MAG: hypothetical protein IKW68_04305 [Clostridia bacterium]|nr:hypothetical protein [Clostridia bacterium]
MKRIFALFIVSAMLAAVLAGCASDGNNAVDTTAHSGGNKTEVTTDENAITTYLEPIDPDLAALDYGDEEFVILSRRTTSDAQLEEGEKEVPELFVDELTNDPVNDAIYNSIQMVNETLGVRVREILVQAGKMNETVGIDIGSGDGNYDLVSGSVIDATPMVKQGYMYNLYDNGIDTYLDTTKPWWAQHWIEQAEIGEDRLYSITGAPALTLSRLLFVTYYNKDLGADLGIEDLYTVVEEGRWTLDYVSSLIPEVYHSLDGDDERDAEDRYGLAMNHYETCDIFWSSCDISLLSKNDEGWFETNTTNRDKLSNVFDKVYSLLYDNTGTYDFGDSSGFDPASEMFASGNVLLAFLHLKYAEQPHLRNMQDEYGIIPTPKYDEKQKEYYSYAHDQYSVLMVPSTVADPERCGAVMELLAYESYKEVQPVYYNTVLKGRYMSDPQSRKMLDIITQNVKIDACWIYGRDLGMPAAAVMRDLLYDGKNTFASAYTKTQNKLPIFLKLFKAEINKLDY